MTIENYRRIIESNREIKRRIQRLTDEFRNFQTDFLRELQRVPKTIVEEEYDFKNFSLGLENPFDDDRIQLAVCGPNGSGKTSFIHTFAQIGNILPAKEGPVSARIVKLTHTTANKACLKVYPSIKAGLKQEEADIHLDLSKFFTSSSINPDWPGIRQMIQIHLERPTNLSEEDFTDWARCFIEIQLPSPILELGIDIYDTPGFLFHDKLVLKDNIFSLVRLVQPLLLFMYVNSSVDNDAHECFLALQSTLRTLEQSTIFFLNTKQDVKNLFTGAGINTNQRQLFTEEKFAQILRTEWDKRLNCMSNHSVMKNYLHTEKSQVDNFDICALPLPRSLLPQCAASMTNQAILRIILFASRLALQKPHAIVRRILNSIQSFFQFSLTTSHQNTEQWKKIREDAQTWGRTFFERFQQQMDEKIDMAYGNILLYFQQYSPSICARAIKLNRFTDPLQSKIPSSSIKQFIETAVQEEIIKLAVNEILNLTKDILRILITREMAIASDHNELLLSAQRQVLIDVSATDLEQRTWFENILFNISKFPITISELFKDLRTRWNIDHWNEKKREDFLTDDEYHAYNRVLDSQANLFNPEKRRDLAQSYLDNMKRSILEQEMLFKRNLKEWINNRQEIFFDNIRSNYHLAIKHLSARQSAHEKTKSFTGEFARIQCHLLAIKYLRKFREDLPIVNTSVSLGRGTFFIHHPAQWGDETNLVVKKLRQPSYDQPYLQYLDAHYHRKITKFAVPNVAPLLYLYVNPRNENDLWLFLPRYSQSLEEYLQKNIRIIQPDQIIRFALDIAGVMVNLHSYEMIHRNLRSRNILLDKHLQPFLTDFRTCKQTTLNEPMTDISSFFSSSNEDQYNGTGVDVYSFGILLYEMLPKLQYHRPVSTANNLDAKELLRNIPSFDKKNIEYESLIESCLLKNIDHRPKALEIVKKLENIRRNLEQKVCISCEIRLRQCRYVPCGHKILCETCHDHSERNEHEQVICRLCQLVVQRWKEDANESTFHLIV